MSAQTRGLAPPSTERGLELQIALAWALSIVFQCFWRILKGERQDTRRMLARQPSCSRAGQNFYVDCVEDVWLSVWERYGALEIMEFKGYFWASLHSTEKSILYEYVWLVGSLASILQWAVFVYLCFIEAMSECKGVEVADVKTDLNRICCPRPSAPAVTGRKDQQMHNMLGVSTVTTVFMLMLESNQACHRCVNVCLHVDDICTYYLYIFVWITFNDCSVSFSEQIVWFSPNFSLRHLVFICSAFLFGRCRLNDPWFFTIE